MQYLFLSTHGGIVGESHSSIPPGIASEQLEQKCFLQLPVKTFKSCQSPVSRVTAMDPPFAIGFTCQRNVLDVSSSHVEIQGKSRSQSARGVDIGWACVGKIGLKLLVIGLIGTDLDINVDIVWFCWGWLVAINGFTCCQWRIPLPGGSVKLAGGRLSVIDHVSTCCSIWKFVSMDALSCNGGAPEIVLHMFVEVVV